MVKTGFHEKKGLSRKFVQNVKVLTGISLERKIINLKLEDKKMPVYCKNCKKENKDDGGSLTGKSCSFCHKKGTLFRTDGSGRIAGAGIGAAIGAGIGGPVGAVIGAAIGFFIGDEAEKNK